MSSVTFPKVAFNSPPKTSLVCIASCSVTNESRSAKGAMAKRERRKTVPGSPSLFATWSAAGKQIMSELNQLSKKSTRTDFVR